MSAWGPVVVLGLSEFIIPAKLEIGGTARVAKFFLPRNHKGVRAIRLKSSGQRIAVARRRLARAIEPRRLAS